MKILAPLGAPLGPRTTIRTIASAPKHTISGPVTRVFNIRVDADAPGAVLEWGMVGHAVAGKQLRARAELRADLSVERPGGIHSQTLDAVAWGHDLTTPTRLRADGEDGEPVSLDALAYAQFRDVPVEEAEEQIRLQGSAEAAALSLEQNTSVTAFWIDTSDSWQLIIGVRDADAWPAILSSLPPELQERSSMVVQEHSDEELATYAAELQEEAVQAGLEASASVDATTETVLPLRVVGCDRAEGEGVCPKACRDVCRCEGEGHWRLSSWGFG